MHRGAERHPGRDRGADEPAVDVGSRLFQRDLDALRNRRRNLAAGVGDYRDELVAAPAPHRSRLADMRLRDFGEYLQGAVAYGVIVPVVDQLEAIEIDNSTAVGW